MSDLVEHERRFICENGHVSWGWQPWYLPGFKVDVEKKPPCVCGARIRMESRTAQPLNVRALVMASEALVASEQDGWKLDRPIGRAEYLAACAVRAYLNEMENRPVAQLPDTEGQG